MSSSAAIPQMAGSLFLKEIRVSWLFTKHNLSTTFIPPVLFTLVAFRASGHPLVELPGVLGIALIYFWFYDYVFDVHNQIVGVEEDRVNKPYRPIAAGLVTREGAWVRLLLGMYLYTLIGWWQGVLVWALAWQAMALFLNLGASRHWLWKNFMMTTGGIVQLYAAWEMVTPITPEASAYILLICMPICLMVSCQDLRDVEGDKLMNRRTFPMVFGDRFTRWEVAISSAMFPVAAFFVLRFYFGLTPLVMVTLAVAVLSCANIAVRVLLLRNKEADHRTYMWFTYWYCFMLAAGFFVLM